MARECIEEGAPFLMMFDGSHGVVLEFTQSQGEIVRNLAEQIRLVVTAEPLQ